MSFSKLSLAVFAIFTLGAQALPQHVEAKVTQPAPAMMTGLAKRQAAGNDLVASISGGSAISKLDMDGLSANPTAMDEPACTPHSDPDSGQVGVQCDCGQVGAVPNLVPMNSVSTYECAYTVVNEVAAYAMGAFGAGTPAGSPPATPVPLAAATSDGVELPLGVAAATSEAPAAFTTTMVAPTTTYGITLESGWATAEPTPLIVTAGDGVVWSYAEISVLTIDGTAWTQGAGAAVPLTTVAAVASAFSATAAAEASAASSQAAMWRAEDTPLCEWSKLFADSAIGWTVILPQLGSWMNTYDYDTARNALRSALFANSACSGFSFYGDGSGGELNTTYGATFITSDFCTAWQVTNVISAATGNAYNQPCVENDSAYDGEAHPEFPDPGVGESIPEEAPIEKRESCWLCWL